MCFSKIYGRNGKFARFLYYNDVVVEYHHHDDGTWLIMFGEYDVPMKLVSTKEEAAKIFNDVSEKFKSFKESSDLIEELKDKLEKEEHNNTAKYDAYLASVGYIPG